MIVPFLQLGVALGFLLPPMMVNVEGNEEAITRDLYVLFITIGIVSTIILVLILIREYC